jgi:PAS domain S-box-containing protein
MDSEMGGRADAPGIVELTDRIRDLELRLAESEETLEAIRRGDVDALVVSGGAAEHRIYTLESADRPYQVLIEQIQEGTVTLDLDATVFYCNRRLAEMLHVPQERLIGHSLLRYLRKDAHDAFVKLLARASGNVVRAELILCTADGEDLPIALSLSLLGANHETPLLCGVLSDLTEQKRHLRELSEANDKLVDETRQRQGIEEALRQSQKMEAVGQLTGGLAHDFNNLLTGIGASLQIMRTRIAQDRFGDLERYIGLALASTDRAAALTHRLLAFARQQTLDPKKIDVNCLVTGVEELVTATIGPTVQFETRLDSGIGMVRCDPNQLENAVLNLAINARDAMPDGGRLLIETSELTFDTTEAARHSIMPGRYVCIAVADSGVGMPPEVIARAFDPFFTTKPLGSGTGLGLSMIYGFVMQSGGQVLIDSRPGFGTTVNLYLPCVEGSPDTTTEVALGTKGSSLGRGETVLVVDDEDVIRMLVVEVLEESGYTVVQAEDGPAALRLLEGSDDIRLLVTDVGLPHGMNGRQLADRARIQRPGLKVIFITGFADGAAVGSADMEVGMEVMAKPFSMEALAIRVQGLIHAPC